MPLHSYQIVNEDGSLGEVVEFFQRMNDAPLERHPETGARLRKLVSAPNISGQYTDRAAKNMLKDNKRLEQLGFTKYERRGKGVMERVAGKFGPKTIGSE